MYVCVYIHKCNICITTHDRSMGWATVLVPNAVMMINHARGGSPAVFNGKNLKSTARCEIHEITNITIKVTIKVIFENFEAAQQSSTVENLQKSVRCEIH